MTPKKNPEKLTNRVHRNIEEIAGKIKEYRQKGKFRDTKELQEVFTLLPSSALCIVKYMFSNMKNL